MKKLTKGIAILMAALILMLSLTGCGEVKNAEKTMSGLVLALKEGNLEEAEKYMNITELVNTASLDQKSEEVYEMLGYIFKNLEHKVISSEKIDKGNVNLKVEITATNMEPVLADFIASYLQYAFANALSSDKSEEELSAKAMEIFKETISKEGLETVTNEVVVRVEKTEEGWKVKSTDELVNALTGNLIKAIEGMSK